jgi:hypothetical protein
MSVARDIASAVASEINAATLPMTVTATQAWIPAYSSEGDQGLTCYVLIAGTQTLEDVSRSATQGSYPIRVGLFQRVNADTDCNGLDDLREAIIKLLISKFRLTAYPSAYVTSVSNVIYDPVELDKNRVWVTDISLTYTVVS